VELLNSLLLSMPGTPVIYYGDEIGMGDNIYLGDRDGVRTPMQWSPDRNGGFSRADPARLVLPPIMDPLYGYQAINVETQSSDAHSLLNWMRRMLTIRKRCRAFGRGTIKLLYPGNRRILAYLRHYESADPTQSQLILCVANLSRSAQAVELNLAQYAGRVPVEMLGGSAFPPIGQLPYLLTLPPHGFHWFLLAEASRMPEWYSAQPEPLPEYITLVLRRGIEDLLSDAVRTRLERDVLPLYLPLRRWFAAKNEALSDVRIERGTMLPHPERPMLLLELLTGGDKNERYLLPVGLLPEEDVITALPQQLALARVRRAHSVSLLTDAVTIDAFARSVLSLLREDARLPAGGGGELRFRSTPRLRDVALPEDAEVRRLAVEQSNTSLVVGDKVVVKLFRKLAEGVHPEAEMGRALTARGYGNIAPLYGDLVRAGADGSEHVLGIVQGFIHNQGDAWAWTQSELERGLRDTLIAATGAGVDDEPLASLIGFAEVMGRRLGEMHLALSQVEDDPAFETRMAADDDAVRLAAQVRARVDEACERLGSLPATVDQDTVARARDILSRRDRLHTTIEGLAQALIGSRLLRIHGDLHLGQVLVAQGDAYFVDFEGEPTRSLAQRRAVATPLRDVAGILRSFDYAAELAARQPRDGNGHDEASRAIRARLLQAFREQSAARFLEAYRLAATGLAHRWRDGGSEQALLDLLLIERAAHEIDYEAANRPDWLDLPLRGLSQRLAALDGGAGHG
jgi:maltose alpha-D-glucosyltransferase/alpha-amylase